MSQSANLCIAADIGGTKLAAALIGDGGVLDRRQAATPSHDPDAVIKKLASLMNDWCTQNDLIAVAATGVVRNGHIYAVNQRIVDGWNAYPLVQRLSEQLPAGKRIVALNDAAAAAWAEYRARTERRANLAFITVSTGIGGGLVLNGRLLEGPSGLAGHLGHMRVADGPRCGCGRQGCAEAIASGTAIAARATELLGTAVDAREVFARAADDPRLDNLITTSAATIARLVIDLKIALDIDIAVIGGSVGLAPGYLERVSAAMTAETAFAIPDLDAAITGADAGLIGVADWARRGIKLA